MSRIATVILGGGRGSRLYPLTKERAKPAVPFGSKYRLIDIALSNCINSGYNRIYLLTQYNSASLHQHIANTYRFDSFSRGFVEILAAEQRRDASGWFEGNADAVRKHLQNLAIYRPDHYLILPGDQLCRMDLRKMYAEHLHSGAEITVAATPIRRDEASWLGLVKVDGSRRIVDFAEKPAEHRDLSDFRSAERRDGREYLASMGMYCFNAAALERALHNDLADFGREVIPALIGTADCRVHRFDGYWRDIGTIKTFYRTNVDLTTTHPRFNLYDEQSPMYAYRHDLPVSRFGTCSLIHTLTAEGSRILDADIRNSIIGVRSRIADGVSLRRVVCLGADYYESAREQQINRDLERPDIGIGTATHIMRAIIDKNARIGAGCRIGIDRCERPDGDWPTHSVRDNIIVVPKNAVIPDNSVI